MDLTDPKIRRAVMAELGRSGGNKRRAALTPERRKEIAKKAADARWHYVPESRSQKRAEARFAPKN